MAAAGASNLCQRDVALVVIAPPPLLLSVPHPKLVPSLAPPPAGPEAKKGTEEEREGKRKGPSEARWQEGWLAGGLASLQHIFVAAQTPAQKNRLTLKMTISK